jgi:UDP-glucuronate decarboxylase
MASNDGRVISNFIIQALKGEEMTMHGLGDQTRSFCYVKDLVEGMYKFLNSSFEISGPLNFGSSTETTMLDLAKTVIMLTNSKSEIVHKALPQDDPDRRRPDLTRTIELIGWEPSTSLINGLQETIQYFKEQFN